jgi:HSP20 family protein
MNRLFDQFFEGFDLGPFARHGGWESVAMPKVDVAETDEAIHVTAELPGMKEEDVEVTLSDGQLTLRGEKKAEQEDSGKNYHRVERSYGSFHRSIPLPSQVDESKVEAAFRDGVLSVTLPKTQTAVEGKKIPVRRLN